MLEVGQLQMLYVMIVAADIKILVGEIEERPPGLLQDAVVTVVTVAEKRVMADGDEPPGRARFGGFGLEPFELSGPTEFTEPGQVGIEHENGDDRDSPLADQGDTSGRAFSSEIRGWP